MEKITSRDQLPDWFELENYDRLTSLEFRELWGLLSHRRQAYQALRALKRRNLSVDEGLPELREKLERTFREPLRVKDAPLFNQASLASHGGTSCIPFSVDDGKKVYEGLRRIFEEGGEPSQTFIDELFPFALVVKIDLNAEDETILHGVKAVVRNHREQLQGHQRVRKVTRTLVANWKKHRVLPYIDLSMWEMMKGVKIKRLLLGEVFFPYRTDVDKTDLVRKNTQKYADEILNSPLLKTMEYRIGKDEGFSEPE